MVGFLGWIPWWDSEIYSPVDHYEKFLGSFGITQIPGVARHLLAGGDLVRTLIDECRQLGVKSFVSYRLNDGHHVRNLAAALAAGQPSHDMSRFFWEHYEAFRIGPDPKDWGQGVLDWSYPEVPAHKFSLIEELVTRYPLDGLELDFLRHWSRFPSEGISTEERIRITTDFVTKVRQALDRSARPGQKRTLAIRVPAKVDLHHEQGIDLPSLAAAGVDTVTLSWSYFTFQDDSIARAKALIPDLDLLVEMTHTTYTGKALRGSGTQPYLRTTDEQFYSTAHLAYEQGATGVSLFNFPYYRAHSIPELGPFCEPPFHVLPKLVDRDFLARQSRWYFLTAARRDPVLPRLDLPCLLEAGQSQSLNIETALSPDLQHDGLLRLRSDEAFADRSLSVSFNGTPLKPVPTVTKPLPHPYEAFLGTPEEIQSFACPLTLVTQGRNQLTITLDSGEPISIVFIDLILPNQSTTRNRA